MMTMTTAEGDFSTDPEKWRREWNGTAVLFVVLSAIYLFASQSLGGSRIVVSSREGKQKRVENTAIKECRVGCLSSAAAPHYANKLARFMFLAALAMN